MLVKACQQLALRFVLQERWGQIAALGAEPERVPAFALVPALELAWAQGLLWEQARVLELAQGQREAPVLKQPQIHHLEPPEPT